MATRNPTLSRGELVFMSAAELAAAIASGAISATEVLEAHLERITEVNPRLNALVVPTFEQARAEALACDRAQADGILLGPLHGVPISVKECFHVAGTASTVGVERLRSELFDVDNPLVTRLRAAGAVVLGKTNVPQLMVLYESVNPVFGRTCNPWDLARNAGGSTGGEAALIAAGGSALGLGSDLGGSVRQPAQACGIHGFKPSAWRLPLEHLRNPFAGMEAFSLQPGLLARHVGDLALGMHVLTADAGPQALPAIARSPRVDVRGLRVGYWRNDGYFRPSPAISRAVDEAAAALRELGADVRPWQPPDARYATHLCWRLITSDGGASLRRLLGSSKRDKRVRKLLTMMGLPRAVRRPAAAVFRTIGQTRLADVVLNCGRVSADEYWQLSRDRAAYAERFLQSMQDAGVDVLLSPTYGLPAMPHGRSLYLLAAASYAMLFSLVGLPAGNISISRVRPGEETARPPSRDRAERDARKIDLGSAGLPVGVQVAAGPNEDERALAVMALLEEHFRGRTDYPLRPPL